MSDSGDFFVINSKYMYKYEKKSLKYKGYSIWMLVNQVVGLMGLHIMLIICYNYAYNRLSA